MATFVQLKNMLTLESEPGPFLSIFLPIGKNDYNDQLTQFKNEIKQKMLDNRLTDQWDDYEDKFNNVHFSRFFNKKRTKGFVIYIGPTILRIFKLNHDIRPVYFIGDTMEVLDLVVDTQFKHVTRSAALFRAALKNIRVHYDEAKKVNQTNDDIDQIINMVSNDQVDTLLINDDAPVSEKNHLYNDLAITTIGHDGRVFVLQNRHMPINKGAAVITR